MLRKGDRVETLPNTKGEIKYGVISKGGQRPTMVLDGGKREITDYAKWFRHSEHPLPKDAPSAMDKYSIKGYKEIEGHGDSPTFSATICKDGKPILTVMNDGWGGCNSYQTLNYHERTVETEDQFSSDVKSWMKQFNCDSIEPEDMWVEWFQYSRPYGVTAETYLGEFTEMMKKHRV